MALKSCKECGKEISTKVSQCPNCGAPIKKESWISFDGVVFFVIMGFALLAVSLNAVPDRKTSTKKTRSSTYKPIETVYNSAWDGSVHQVERFLKKTLKDPKSFDAIEWSPVKKVNLSTHKFIVRCKYRAKNSFGGYVITNQLFYLDAKGRIVNVKHLR